MNFDGIQRLAGLHAGASKSDIQAAEAGLNISFPVNYKLLLEYTDGLLLDSGVSLYSVNDIRERNDTYEVFEYCKGFLLIGDDSGGRGFLISLNNLESKIYGSGLGDLDPSEFVPIATSLQDWVEKGLAI